MRLRDFALLTDENIAPSIVSYLRARGFDVADVKERGLVGREDLDILRVSYRERRVLLTHDRDFGGLVVMQSEPLVGIVFLRPGHAIADVTIASLEAVGNSELDLRPPFILVAENVAQHIRLRLRSF